MVLARQVVSLKKKFQVVLNQKGDLRCLAGPPVVKPQAAAASQPPLVADLFGKVIDNLKQRGQSRPRTLKTLTGTVGSLFPKGLPEGEVALLVQRLQATGKIAVADNGKVSDDL